MPRTRSNICRRCKNEYVLTSDRSVMYCPDCLKLTNAKRNRTNNSKIERRPLTEDTEMLVCLYHSRGDSPKRIAADLRRPVEQINDILSDAKKSGRYKIHIYWYNMYIKSGIPQSCAINSFQSKKQEVIFYER